MRAMRKGIARGPYALGGGSVPNGRAAATARPLMIDALAAPDGPDPDQCRA